MRRGGAIGIVLAAALGACSGSTGEPGPVEPDPDVEPDAVETLSEQLTMFFRLDEECDCTRRDHVSGVELKGWQRTGYGEYDRTTAGLQAVPAVVGLGQHVSGAGGHHFSTKTHAAMEHGGGSFTWAGWAAVDALDEDAPYTDEQALVAKWNTQPDDDSEEPDQREYRVFFAPERERWQFEVSRDGTGGSEVIASVAQVGTIERDRLYFVEAWYDAGAGTINLRVSDDQRRGDVASTDWPHGVFEGPADLNVAAENSCMDNHLQGTIDALGHWTRVLTEEESTALWNDGAGLEP